MPAQPKLATASPKFPTWDQMVAEANGRTPEDVYLLPFSEDDVVEIPCPDGDRYLDLVDGQRRGDAMKVMESLFPDKDDRAKVRSKMRGVHFDIVDMLATNVLRHYYGLSIVPEEKSGNSDAS